MNEENEKNTEETENRKAKRGKRAFIISAAVIVAAAVVIISSVLALRGRDSMEINGAVYTYVHGKKVGWPEGVKLSHRDNVTYLDGGNGEQHLEEFPLISEEDGKIIIQKSCSWNRVSDNAIYRVDYFTEIGKDEEGVFMNRRGKEARDMSGFLYDNRDTYIFLEPAVLYIGGEGGEIRKLEPLTAVRVTYMDDIQIFDPYGGEYYKELEVEDVVAVFENNKRVNLAIDHYYLQNGSWRLLFLGLDGLQEMKTGGADDEEE